MASSPVTCRTCPKVIEYRNRTGYCYPCPAATRVPPARYCGCGAVISQNNESGQCRTCSQMARYELARATMAEQAARDPEVVAAPSGATAAFDAYRGATALSCAALHEATLAMIRRRAEAADIQREIARPAMKGVRLRFGAPWAAVRLATMVLHGTDEARLSA